MNLSSLYERHRFPPEIISYCVWLSFRFPLSYRNIEELMAAEARRFDLRNRPAMVPEVWSDLRKPPASTGILASDIWHLGEIFLMIHGQRCYL